ncbi:MAG: class I SAM-dependent methyltransferase [Proteobacteria bacterium]|nr:class I SAM-dependent methyltransferase [Pseudomonadota bacterium]
MCEAPTCYRWSLRLLGCHDVKYFECRSCGSLQTEAPYWLTKAYSIGGAGFDTGAVQRSINLALSMHAILDLIGFDKRLPCLDFGAGAGLYARMMRDRGYNYWASDPYNSIYFMDRFTDDRTRWSLISAFEVAEHMPNPRCNWAELFAKEPDLLFFTTDLYRGHGADWPYLSTETGQHVFFYTEQALMSLGSARGYHLAAVDAVRVFSRSVLPDLSSAEIWRRAMELFAEHQRDPFRHAVIDLESLKSAKSDT